jgi:hypothetical protein
MEDLSATVQSALSTRPDRQYGFRQDSSDSRSLLMPYGGALYREIFLDGRELPKDPNPDWMVHSVGRWNEDTFIGRP